MISIKYVLERKGASCLSSVFSYLSFHLCLCHSAQLRGEQPSYLKGDNFFKFVCVDCSDDGKESFERMRLTWQQVCASLLPVVYCCTYVLCTATCDLLRNIYRSKGLPFQPQVRPDLRLYGSFSHLGGFQCRWSWLPQVLTCWR